jgi:hypothetical protein
LSQLRFVIGEHLVQIRNHHFGRAAEVCGISSGEASDAVTD